jgi:AraC-like DNA-binding protein
MRAESTGNLDSMGITTLEGAATDHCQSYQERVPDQRLAGVLSCVWTLKVSEEGPAYEHRAVPNGCIEIACPLDPGVPRLVGPRRTVSVDSVHPGGTVIGVRFRPGISPAFFGTPATELVDASVDLEVVWGPSALRLAGRLAGAASPREAAALLEAEIARRWATLDPDPLVAEAVRRLQPWRSTSVVDAANKLFISPRQLRRRFQAALGYGPKLLQRILRFQGFLAVTQEGESKSFTISQLASTAGYADQAHLSRDCVELAGLAPGAFLSDLRLTCGPTHDHTASFGPLRASLFQASTTRRNGG